MGCVLQGGSCTTHILSCLTDTSFVRMQMPRLMYALVTCNKAAALMLQAKRSAAAMNACMKLQTCHMDADLELCCRGGEYRCIAAHERPVAQAFAHDAPLTVGSCRLQCLAMLLCIAKLSLRAMKVKY